MKLASHKKLYLLTGIILLVLLLILSVKSLLMNVNATNAVYQIRMLEITDNGLSDLAKLKSDMSNLTVDTMSMKRFVALRDDLDGKYDSVYIGKGIYSKSGVQNKEHNTLSVMNDITRLKAKELIDDFINKGLYVFFNRQPFDNQTVNQHGNLYNTFSTYRTLTPKSNVIFVNNNELETLINNLITGTSTYLPGLKQRPRLQITNKGDITDYSKDQNHIYKPGDELNFKFSVSNNEDYHTHPIIAKLYISVDKSIKMTESQVVAVTTLTQGPNGEITYKLPNTYSGLLYWKLEISDHLNANKLKDFDSGTIRFRGKKTIVNVLQVLPNTTNERSSSLLDSNNMKQSYLLTDDYELNIRIKTINEFNSYVDSHYAADKTYGLNGVYDMLIFGFRDVYNDKAPISDRAAEAVINFTEVTKQSAMFTHDTVYKNTSRWVKYFKDITGQIEPETNLGLNAPNTSTTVKPVNDGLLTQYPFYLSTLNDHNEQKDIIPTKVATTHNQYYTLNLEDSSIIPWYNIIGSSRDTTDSWNHYYTYSKGNVTYSGTGHIFGTSSDKFPEWEQKLFVNTIYRAYIGANHAPEITVNAPQQNEVKPSYQHELLIDYAVEDSDLKDRDLLTTIRFKSNGVYLPNTGLAETLIQSGKSIHQSFPNPLPEGGPLTIEITAHDKQGAQATPKNIDITILKTSTNLEVTRELSSNVNDKDEIRKDERFTITYSIRPKSVPFDKVSTADQSVEHQVISELLFKETLPAKLKLEGDLPSGMTTPSGNVDTGFTLEKRLEDITYTLKTVNGVKTFVPDSDVPISFSIHVSATVATKYNFDNALVDFVDIHAIPFSFNPTQSSTGSALGFAGDYNAFIFGEARVTASLKGNLAAGGNTTTSGVDINQSTGKSVPYALVTGGDLNFTDGSVYGNILHQGIYNNVYSGNIVNGTYSKGTLIDFETARQYYVQLSDQLAAVQANGTSRIEYGNLYLTGNQPVNIFHFTAGDHGENFPSGWPKVTFLDNSTIIYTIYGKNINFNKAFGVPTGTDGSNVIYNFPTALTLNISGVDIRGSILAPSAALNISNGQVHGNVIAASLNASSLVDILPYTGSLPVTIPTSTPAPLPSSLPHTFIQFSPMTVTAIDRITSLQLLPADILLGDNQMMSVTIEPTYQSNEQLNWHSSNEAIVSVSPLGVVSGKKVGSADITASTTDGSNINTTAKVTVLNPSLNISGPATALVNERIDVRADYLSSKETGIMYSWSVVDQNKKEIDVVTLGSDPQQAYFTASKSGDYTVTVRVQTDLNTVGIPVSKTIKVGLASLTISGPTNVLQEGTINLNVTTDPTNASEEQFEWTLVNVSDLAYAGFINSTDSSAAPTSSIVTSEKNVQLKGLSSKEGIQIIVKAAGISSEIYKVNVSDPGLIFYPNSGVITVGQSLALLPYLNTKDPYGYVPANIVSRLHWEIVTNEAKDDSAKPAIELGKDGNVTGISKGNATVKAYYVTLGGLEIKALYNVKVEGKEDTIDNRY